MAKSKEPRKLRTHITFKRFEITVAFYNKFLEELEDLIRRFGWEVNVQAKIENHTDWNRKFKVEE